MASPEETWKSKRARIAAHHRNRPEEPVPDELLRDLRAARAENWARSVAKSAPPLTAEQRVRIVLIILGGAA